MRRRLRFRLRVPPGYRDADKDAQESDQYASGGIVYKRKFGDYLIWRQILLHARESGTKRLIFVTDDSKDDWWSRIESDGPKTIGPRPELIEEARVEGSIETFLMYNPEGFLKYAKEFLRTPVSDAALTEVRDVSAERAIDRPYYRELQRRRLDAEEAVLCWLRAQFDDVKESKFGFPDFVATRDGKLYWFEAIFLRHSRTLLNNRIMELATRATRARDSDVPHEFAIILVAYRMEDIERIRDIAVRRLPSIHPGPMRVIIGLHEQDADTAVGRFRLCDDFRLGGA